MLPAALHAAVTSGCCGDPSLRVIFACCLCPGRCPLLGHAAAVPAPEPLSLLCHDHTLEHLFRQAACLAPKQRCYTAPPLADQLRYQSADENLPATSILGGAAAPKMLKSARKRLVNTKRGDMPVALRKLYTSAAGGAYPPGTAAATAATPL